MTVEHFLIIAFNEFRQHVTTRARLCRISDLEAEMDEILEDFEEAKAVYAWVIDGEAFIDRQADPIAHRGLPWV